MPSIPRFDPARHHRRSIRLKGFDYTTPDRYFVTFCTHERHQWFGSIANGVMRLNANGVTARDQWSAIPGHYQHVRIDAFIIMPDHVHGIIELIDHPLPSAQVVLVGQRPIGPAKGSLGAIIGSYRAGVVREMNRSRTYVIHGLWQRGYHDIIIRNERSLERIRDYIGRHPGMVDR